jgi:hypothetical protein
VGLGHKRSSLQSLAQTKLDDAIILLNHKRFSNAFYLAGYTIELGLKACIAAQFTVDTIPDKGFVDKIYSHDLKQLVKLAGLATELQQAEDRDVNFAANWAIAAQWSESSRYEPQDAMSAQALIAAINDQNSGVLQWIKNYW